VYRGSFVDGARDWENDECIISDVNVAEMAKMALTPREFLIWEKFEHKSAEHKRLDNLVDLECKREFWRQAKSRMTVAEYDVYDKVFKFQELNGSRFRVYGGITGIKSWIVLVTEMRNFLSEKKFWNELKDIAAMSGAKIELMTEDTCLDKMGVQPGGKTEDDVRKKLVADGRTLVNDGKPDKGGWIWSTGPDHGRPQKQVELSWDILHMTDLQQVKTLIKQLSACTDKLWPVAGIGVI